MNFIERLMEEIGDTPLKEISKLAKNVYLKLEYFNPTGSIKDRIIFPYLEALTQAGELTQKQLIIPSTGSAGISLALYGKVKGKKVTVVIPEKLKTFIKILKSLGAEVKTVHGGPENLKEAVEVAYSLVDSKSFLVDIYNLEESAQIHYRNTGAEIFNDIGNVDYFVSCASSGGTITGVGKYLKKKNPELRVVLVEPDECSLFSKGECNPHFIPGAGGGFIPDTFDLDIIDEVITVTTSEAQKMMKLLTKKEGIMAGISTGANCAAAIKLQEEYGNNIKIVTIAFDTGLKYIDLI